jgi:TonB family protein
MPPPDTYGLPASWDEESSGRVGDVVSSEDPRDKAEIARTLAAHGGGAASFDLALDLVLNEVVEQARLATGATGAVVALTRDGEMVCRATTGANAPGLGIRLETKSGLSGACLESGTAQQCGDTQTDPRVDAAAWRRLGVRSILVFPLGEGKNPFGLFEIFSSRPNAFGDRDVNTLRVLARRLEENAREAKQVEAAVSSGDDESSGHAEEPTSASQEQLFGESLGEQQAALLVAEAAPKRRERWTLVLSALVIAVAMSLGLALGWRAGAGERFGTVKRRERTSSTQSASQGTESAEEQKTLLPVSELGSSSGRGSPTQGLARATLAEPGTGGLQVTQNGKVVYRLPPAEQRTAVGSGAIKEGSASSDEEVSRTRLMHRVDPEYPPEARRQGIQGAVVLDVQIGSDGAVRNITIVSGEPLLGEAAIHAVKQWRYQPSVVDGWPVEMQARITIRFTLPPS